MRAPPRSGFTLPNRFARITLQVFEEMIGSESMNTFLTECNLASLIDNYPPANLERGFDFAHFSALNAGLEKLYGIRGGRGSALRAGRKICTKSLAEFWPLMGSKMSNVRYLPQGEKMKLMLPLSARLFSQVSDQASSVRRRGNEYDFIIYRNAVCWGRRGEEKPVCFLFSGFLAEAITRLTGETNLRVDETECMASGAEFCRFVIQKTPHED